MKCKRCEKELSGRLDTYGDIGDERCFECWCREEIRDKKAEMLNERIESAQDELSDLRGELEWLDEDDFDNQREFEYEVGILQENIEVLEEQIYALKCDLRQHLQDEKLRVEKLFNCWMQLTA